MEIPLMALLAPRRTLAPTGFSRLGALGRRVLFALAFAVVASAAQAQVTVGGNHSPDVTVDQSVLDQLGPPPTLPQLFGAQGAAESRGETPHLRLHPATKSSRSAAKAKKATKTRKPLSHKTRTATSAHKAKAPVSHRLATHRPTVHAAPSRQVAKSPPAPPESKPVAAAPAPAQQPVIAVDSPPPPTPLPASPQPIAVPPPPVLPPTPPHIEAPNPAGKPPAEARADSPPTPLVPTPAVASTVKPEAPAAAKPAAQPAAVQVASVAHADHALSVVKFAPGATELATSDQPILDATAAKLLANEALRVQLVAHATGGADEAMEARRVSLARAVAVRAYLISKGVRSLRMDVRALGNHPGEGPVADEVDLVLVTQ